MEKSKFIYDDEDALVVIKAPTELEGEAAKQYAALENLWEAQDKLDQAELDLLDSQADEYDFENGTDGSEYDEEEEPDE